jgi:hypothetical protein
MIDVEQWHRNIVPAIISPVTTAIHNLCSRRLLNRTPAKYLESDRGTAEDRTQYREV